MLCGLGTACIYYGTEQGFSGSGSDNQMREAMFDLGDAGKNLLNTNCKIYRAIADIAGVMRKTEPLRFGRMYYRQISGDGVQFGFPFGSTYTLAFSRVLYGQEVLVDETAARLEDGTLAGSVLALDQAVRNVVAWTGSGVAEACRMASEVPARLLGLRAKGRLAVGFDADLVLLDDGLRVLATFTEGRCLFHRPPTLSLPT